MSGQGTNYVLLKRCLKCWNINEAQNHSCSKCNHLFVREATDEEKIAANDKLVKMQMMKENDLKELKEYLELEGKN